MDDKKIDGWLAARIVAEDIASVFVGTLGFCLGSSYSTEIVSVIDESGTAHITSIRPENEAGETLGIGTQIFDDASRLSGKNIFFRVALNDYTMALQEATNCAFYCYRAIEAIKNIFGDWQSMHNALGSKKSEIDQKIKEYADPVRHGNWNELKVTNKDQRWEALHATREILKKYLEYSLAQSVKAGDGGST